MEPVKPMQLYEITESMDYYFIDPHKHVKKGQKSHCPIDFDNDNKRLFCHLCFDSKQKYIRVFDNESREEVKISINTINEFIEIADHFQKHS